MIHNLRIDLTCCSLGSGGASEGRDVNCSGKFCWDNECWAKKASSPSCSGVPKRSDEWSADVGEVPRGGGSGGGRNRLSSSWIVGGTKR